MTVVSTTKDAEALTLTIVAELAATPGRVWQVWSDPRQLERWWGPPDWPATFEAHDLRVGGTASYYMTGPQGEKMRGAWLFTAVDEPRSLEFEDFFADESGTADRSMPVLRAHVDLAAAPQGTRMTVTNHFATADQMAQLVEMGMVEGMTGAMGQLDEVVAA